LLYIQVFSATLQKQGRAGLSSQWTITPVGGGDKIPTFVALIGARKGMKVAALIGGRKKEEHVPNALQDRTLLKKSHVLTFSEFSGALEAGIEDMFDETFFLDIVNAEFKPNMAKAVTSTDLDSHIPNIHGRLEAYFQANPMRGGVSYSRYRPARYFAERMTTLESRVSRDTFDRFEAAFSALNELLD